MTKELFNKIEKGTLVVIECKKGYYEGKKHVVIFNTFDRNLMREDTYYYCGCVYPRTWLRLAKQDDLDEEIALAKDYYEKRVNALNKAFELTKGVK